MPMRGELTVPAIRTGSEIGASNWRQIFGDFRGPDLLVVIIFSLVGLLTSVMLMLLLPFSADIAAGLSQLS